MRRRAKMYFLCRVISCSRGGLIPGVTWSAINPHPKPSTLNPKPHKPYTLNMFGDWQPKGVEEWIPATVPLIPYKSLPYDVPSTPIKWFRV